MQASPPGFVPLVAILALLAAAPACPAFETDFGAIGVAEMRPVREQAAQVDAVVELRLDQLLAPTMSAHAVDCWIVVWAYDNPDPLIPLLTLSGTAPEGRAVLALCVGSQGLLHRSALGLGLDVNAAIYEVREPGPEGVLAEELRELLENRGPRRIAVNRSPERPYADGLSASSWDWLQAALGPDLITRVVSSGAMVEEFLGRHLEIEEPLFMEVARLNAELLERVLTDEYVAAAHTSLSELTWSVEQLARDLGLRIAIRPRAFLQRPGRPLESEGIESFDVLIQQGDLVYLTAGIEHLGYVTRFGRWVYMLPEGEGEAPEWIGAGLERLADALEGGLPGLRPELPASEIETALRQLTAPAQSEALAIRLGRVGYLFDRGILDSDDEPVTLLWATDPPLLAGSTVVISARARATDPGHPEQTLWLALLESAYLGPRGARLAVPAQRRPLLID